MNPGAQRPEPGTIVVLSKKGFAEGTAKPFESRIRGRIFQGLVVRKGGRYFAYRNLCRHLPITLDLNDGDFFTHDRRHLQCHMHGAIYEITTGLCVGGPCEGASLVALELTEEEDRLVIRVGVGEETGK